MEQEETKIHVLEARLKALHQQVQTHKMRLDGIIKALEIITEHLTGIPKDRFHGQFCHTCGKPERKRKEYKGLKVCPECYFAYTGQR